MRDRAKSTTAGVTRAGRCGLLCALLLFLIAAAARAELTVFAGVEYFDWQEDTSPSVQETGPLLAGGLIWMQDKQQGLLFGYRGEIYFGQVQLQRRGVVHRRARDARTLNTPVY